jgi:integrase/recombinase XerD
MATFKKSRHLPSRPNIEITCGKESEMKSITLDEAYREYRNNKLSDGYSENTLLIYDWTIGEMIRVLNNPPVAEVTLQDLRKFMLYFRVEYRTQQGKPLSGSSLENAWKGIRSLFGWAALTLGIERPDRDLPRPRYTSKEVEPFTMEEVKKLLDACMYTRMSTGNIRKPYKRRRGTGPRDKALILLLADTGLRISEALRLNFADINLENHDILIQPYRSGQKTKSRHVPIGKLSRSALWKYLIERDPAPHEPVFASRNSLTPMTRDVAYHIIWKLGERAGVPNAHPHRFRHTFAVEFLRNGGDIVTATEDLGAF